MARLAFARYADFAQYDLAQSTLRLLDPAQPPVLLPLTDLAAARAPIAALAALDAPAGMIAAAYALALAARQWHERPTDARRGAIIQAAALLQPASATHAASLLSTALAAADAALLANRDPATAIVAAVDAHVRLEDRAAERCGRHAAGLIERGDRVLCAGFGGPALLALLGSLPPDVAPSISLAVADPSGLAVALLEGSTRAAGIAVAPAPLLQPPQFAAATICIASARAVATDGGAVCAAGAGAVLEAARAQGIPCYLLAARGPNPDAPTAHMLVAGGGAVDLLAPELISAFITDRGLYRPAMIARYLSDGEAPLDVIPLLS